MRVEVTEEQFTAAMMAKDYLMKDTNMIFEPAITFFWDHKPADASFGKGSFGHIVHDYDPKTGEQLPPKFFLGDL